MDKNKIINIESGKPHITAELICLKCLYRYQGVFPVETPLKLLECGKCGEVGFIITTGQYENE